MTLRKPWEKLFPNPLALLVVLFIPLAALRAYGYFGEVFFKGPPVMLGYISMGFIPFIFLTESGREAIGLRRPNSRTQTLFYALAGAAAALFCYYLGLFFYGKTDLNWFVSIGYTFLADERLAQLPRDLAFIAFTVPAMVASPIGEEFFFRGMIHTAVEERWNWSAAATANATLFALVHLAHHGIFRSLNGIEVMPISGAIWFVLMFGVSIVFTIARRATGSIWASVLAHSMFNLVMNATIFYSLFVS